MIASEAKYHPGCLLALYSKANKCIGDDTKAAAHQIPNCIKKTINKIRRKRFSIWRMELFHPAMWHHDIEFTKWQHPQCGTWIWDDNMSLSSPGGITLDTDIAILPVDLCTRPSVIFYIEKA